MKKGGGGIKLAPLTVYLTHSPYKSLGLSVSFIITFLAVIDKVTNLYLLILTNIDMYIAINIIYR